MYMESIASTRRSNCSLSLSFWRWEQAPEKKKKDISLPSSVSFPTLFLTLISVANQPCEGINFPAKKLLGEKSFPPGFYSPFHRWLRLILVRFGFRFPARRIDCLIGEAASGKQLMYSTASMMKMLLNGDVTKRCLPNSTEPISIPTWIDRRQFMVEPKNFPAKRTRNQFNI